MTLLSPVLCRAQTPSCDSIVWRADKKLTWDDFKAVPNANDLAAARTRSNFVREWRVSKNELETKMICFFSPCLSWSKNKASERLLRHEQGHFDITELYKRLYYKRIVEATYTPATLQAVVTIIYRNITQECGNFQDAYDRETNHSLKEDKQSEWEQKIAALLKDLEAYDREEVSVSLVRR
ncbi:DUF922 domain-containing protein [Mucilaginibacter sp. PAMB04274]|uniref:DUF922 domain-containing protein n=1 Tax=Mucilaginibacter sp. PAMB04274 TaxID=3138568 RepID=UPI0031F6B294